MTKVNIHFKKYLKIAIDKGEFKPKLIEFANIAEIKCQAQFANIQLIFEQNQKKVLSAFISNRVATNHLFGSNGYGYGDAGRETIDKVFAEVLGAEAAFVRHTFTCGTHALNVCLFGILRPNDHMLCITGKPYDSMEEVIGLRGNGNGSLKDFGIVYSQIELLEGKLDFKAIAEKCKDKKLIYIQRSRGYSSRLSICIDEIAEIVKLVRQNNSNTIIMVDNCYGEFVEEREPCNVGVDICAGSLIKNLGGGIVKTGGYIAGKKELVELCAYRLSAPGIGKDVGCSLDQNRDILLGLFLSPQTVANAVKTAVFCSALFEDLGFETSPRPTDFRTDIVQSIKLNTAENLKQFCLGIQAGSPVDSFVTPEEWDMPGYDTKIIMAAGGFTMGSTIETSADGPMKEPFIAYLQGGLTYPSGKLCVMNAASHIMKNFRKEGKL